MSIECNKNNCPAGVATQRPDLVQGLVVEAKYGRIANFHDGTLVAVAEILTAAGIKDHKNLGRKHIWRRISFSESKTYEQMFPYPDKKPLKDSSSLGSKEIA